MSNTYYIRARISGYADFSVEAADEDAAIQMIEWGEADHDDMSVDEYTDCEVMDVEYGESEINVNVNITLYGVGSQEDLECGARNRVEDYLNKMVREDDGVYVSTDVFKVARYDINEVEIDS